MWFKLNGDDDGDGESFARERLGIDGFPTFVVLDAQAREIDRFSGYGDPEGWARELTQALGDPTTIEEQERRFAAAPSVAAAERLGDWNLKRGNYEQAIARYRVGQKLDPTAAHRFWIQVLRAAMLGFEREAAGFDRARLLSIAGEPFAPPAPDPETLLSAASELAELPESFDTDVVGPAIQRALAATEPTTNPEQHRRRARLLVIKAMRFDHDPAAAVTPRRDSMAEGWQSDPFAINEFAWWCFEQGVNTDEAFRLALRALELLPAQTPGARRAMILDTAAELALRRNDLARARELWTQAGRVHPESEHYSERLAATQAAAPLH